jgi:hypothetical protein
MPFTGDIVRTLYRGQGAEKWLLESNFERLAKRIFNISYEVISVNSLDDAGKKIKSIESKIDFDNKKAKDMKYMEDNKIVAAYNPATGKSKPTYLGNLLIYWNKKGWVFLRCGGGQLFDISKIFTGSQININNKAYKIVKPNYDFFAIDEIIKVTIIKWLKKKRLYNKMPEKELIYLTRFFKSFANPIGDGIHGKHIERFKYYAKNYANLDRAYLDISNVEHWWALGQHHGLSTPLLDWTESPYIAAFFAFAECSKDDNDGDIVIWQIFDANSLQQTRVNKKLYGVSPQLYVFKPETVSPRVIAQRSWFTFNNAFVDMETWLQFVNSINNEFSLHGRSLNKFIIPRKDRKKALQFLHDKMNINYMTLFPDIHGASMHANLLTEIGG